MACHGECTGGPGVSAAQPAPGTADASEFSGPAVALIGPYVPARRLYHGWRRHLKRGIDISLGLLLLLLFLPLMAIIAVVVKLSSPGPVLFRQERVGAGGSCFSM